jgi:ATP-dependent DNA helicase 2 subunit 1
VKHSQFIYPDEAVRHSPPILLLTLTQAQTYAGSKRTFAALLKSMLKKKKIGICLALTRRNASPVFCAMLPQVHTHAFGQGPEAHDCRRSQRTRAGGTTRPGSTSFRSRSRTTSARRRLNKPSAVRDAGLPLRIRSWSLSATDELKDAARVIIDKLSIKNGSYPPDSYPNPGTGRTRDNNCSLIPT